MSEPKSSKTYDVGCHCGCLSLSVNLSPVLEEQKINNCDCSACRRFGYLLVYMPATNVTWLDDSRARASSYEFNTKTRDHLFCPHCGASIGIHFREMDPPHYGLSVRAFNEAQDLHALTYRRGEGLTDIQPAGDVSGGEWTNIKAKLEAEAAGKAES